MYAASAPDQVIDYKAQDFTEVVSGCDAVFDTVGGDVALRSFAVLRPGGRAAFIGQAMRRPLPRATDVASCARRSAGIGRTSSALPIWSPRARCAFRKSGPIRSRRQWLPTR
jgi:NADPH:quinone reductase-like Zn-dependent oxidoreductase